uniref:Uncharacterized protein n=1 Tax=Rhizophora mucronata TaxID=61149 RepID=A0A2P2QMP6_RHIMU
MIGMYKHCFLLHGICAKLNLNMLGDIHWQMACNSCSMKYCCQYENFQMGNIMVAMRWLIAYRVLL